MVGHQVLVLSIGVRVPVPQPVENLSGYTALDFH